jgi:N-acetylneuraminate synthase
MRQLFRCETGVSDHTPGLGVAVAGVALGASIVEKHLTLLRADGGVDSAFSMEPGELRQLVLETERAWRALGDIRYGPTEGEKASLRFRRSLYVTEPMRAGERLTPANLRAIRPGLGLPPKYFDVMIGKRVNRDLKKGTPLSFELVG